jgi:disulfide bond formation protein DsbB
MTTTARLKAATPVVADVTAIRDPRRAVLAAIALVAAVATVGSLWFSLGLGLVPCTLCWYQRVLMYPLAVVLGVAVVERRPAVWKTALPFVAVGTPVAAYHSLLQITASATGRCTTGGCTTVQYPMLGGLLTIPRLSLLGFALVGAGVVYLAVGDRVPVS